MPLEKIKASDILKIPNLLTLSRLCISITIIILFFLNDYLYIVKWLFVIGVLTDTLDGNIARKFNMKSRLGVVLEPIADTLLVFSTVLFVTFKLDLSKYFFLIYLGIFFIGLVNVIFVYLIKRKWFAEKLVVSEVAITFVYATGVFYLFNLPFKTYLAIFSIGFGIAALADLIIRLAMFRNKDLKMKLKISNENAKLAK